MTAKAAPFRLLVITPEASYPQETSWVNRLFENGLQTLHLRKPGWAMHQLIAYLQEISREFHARVMVHHEAALLEHFSLQGLHLQPHTLPKVKPACTVSCPVHGWGEFLEIQERVDYALISPFFNSISKTGYEANLQLQQVAPEANRLKAVALGGVNLGRIEALRQKQLGGAALLGAIWQAADPLAAFLDIDKKVKNGG